MTDNNYCACNGGDANYIIRLNQQGAPGEKGDKGDQGFSPVVSYIANDDVVQFTLVNEGNIQTTPNFYDYFASKSLDNIEYDNPFSVNGISLYEADSNTSFVLTNKNNLGLQANNTIGLQVSDSSNHINRVALNDLTDGTSTGVTIETEIGDINIDSAGIVDIEADGSISLYQGDGKMLYLGNGDINSSIRMNAGGHRVDLSRYGFKYDNHNIATVGDIPTNYVTTDTAQTITGNKTFSGSTSFDATNGITIGNNLKLSESQSGEYIYSGTTLYINTNNHSLSIESSGLYFDGTAILDATRIANNYVSLTTNQTISGNKTFTNGITIGSNLKLTEDNSGEYIYTSTTSPIQISNSAHSIRIESGGVYADNYLILTTGNMANSVVTLSTPQIGDDAITGNKQFKGYAYFTGGKTIIQNSDNSKNIATISSDASDNLTITSQQTNAGIDLIPNGTGKVMYNGNEVATKSDIPTNNDIEAHKAWTTLGTLITLNNTKAYNNLKTSRKYSFDINKFIIQGTPNINASHEMSNITNSNYASLNQYHSSGSWKIEFNAKCTQSASLQYFLDIFDPSLVSPNVSEIVVRRTQNSNSIVFYFFKTGKTALALTITDDSNDYYIAIEYNASTDTYKCTVNETTSTFGYTGYSLNTSSDYNISFGARTFTGVGADALTTGSIDLSSISMTGGFSFDTSRSGVDKYNINGALVEIPYVITNQGAKIVDISYQNRLQQVETAIGSGGYLLLDETNERFCLPYGDIYGAIGLRTLRDKYKKGGMYYEIYSDGTLEQGGTCTANTPVEFFKPFADTNYVLTIPYSSKTTTGFVPSQAGGWIAKGDCILW